MSSEYDVCVVGSGAGGGVAAAELARQGVRVLLLEAGPRYDPSRFPSHDHDFELAETPFEKTTRAPEHKSWEAPPGAALDPDFAELRSTSPTIYSGPARARRQSFEYGHVIGLGGTTLHYQGEAHRFPPHAFRMREQLGAAADWPLAYEELAPYYERVEQWLGVAGDAANPFKAERGAYPSPAHQPSHMGRYVGAAAQRLGWASRANPLAILNASRPGREACHYCNGCVRGCAVGAKSSVDLAILPDGLATGNLTIRTERRVLRLEHGADGRITAVVSRGMAEPVGREERHRARAFVLATGAIQTPRLLLASAGGAHSDGVGNATGQVGVGLMETLYVFRWGHALQPLESHVGVPIESRIWDFNRSPAAQAASVAADFPNGLVLGQMAGLYEGPVGTALEGVEGFGRAHREKLRASFGSGITLLGMAEQLPRPENRVVLSDNLDAHGVPLARIESTPDTADLVVLRAMLSRLRELEAECGLVVAGQTTAYETPSATHVGGTCRMGDDAATSVVDAEGFVRGVANLAVADASVLVTQGAGDSPSLTIQALALRTAQALVRRASNGEI